MFVPSPLGDLRLTSAAIARYTPVTGRDLIEDLSADKLVGGGVVSLLWACRYHDGRPTLDDVADSLDTLLESGGDLPALLAALNECVTSSGWVSALMKMGEADPTTPSGEQPSPQG